MGSERLLRNIKHQMDRAAAVSKLDEEFYKQSLEAIEGVHMYERGRIWITQELRDKLGAATPAPTKRDDGMPLIFPPLGSIQITIGKPKPEHFVGHFQRSRKKQTNAAETREGKRDE